MPVERITPASYYAMVSTDDIITQDLTDPEFRVYTYYRSHSKKYDISATKTAVALHKSKRTIEEINKNLIRKGYLLIKGHSNPIYYVGIDAVMKGYKEDKKYFDDKKIKNLAKSERQKQVTKLTSENRLRGSKKKRSD